MMIKFIAMLFCLLAAIGGLLFSVYYSDDHDGRNAWVALAGIAAFIAGIVGMLSAGALL